MMLIAAVVLVARMASPTLGGAAAAEETRVMPEEGRLPAGMRGTPVAESRRVEASHIFEVRGQVDEVFGLFDPVSERDWVDDWDPQPIYPEQLSRAAGTVYTLERDGRTAVWTILRYEPTLHVAEYLVAEPDYLHRWIHVSCSGSTDATTRVSVRYVTTALSPAGQQDINRYGEEFLKAWEAPVQAAIDELKGKGPGPAAR